MREQLNHSELVEGESRNEIRIGVDRTVARRFYTNVSLNTVSEHTRRETVPRKVCGYGRVPGRSDHATDKHSSCDPSSEMVVVGWRPALSDCLGNCPHELSTR